eukprot:285638-Chlamydomonas_euryale.AAC.2
MQLLYEASAPKVWRPHAQWSRMCKLFCVGLRGDAACCRALPMPCGRATHIPARTDIREVHP